MATTFEGNVHDIHSLGDWVALQSRSGQFSKEKISCPLSKSIHFPLLTSSSEGVIDIHAKKTIYVTEIRS